MFLTKYWHVTPILAVFGKFGDVINAAATVTGVGIGPGPGGARIEAERDGGPRQTGPGADLPPMGSGPGGVRPLSMAQSRDVPW
jgi:hypothetical protein